MRKILLFSFAVLSLALTGCDMNKQPFSSINPENALQSMADAQKLHNFVYANFRGMTSGAYVYAGDFSTDLFHASIGFGNNGGDMYTWSQNASNDNASGVWSGLYSAIANDNFFIQSIQKYVSSQTSDNPISDADMAQLNIYKGEAYFSRAYAYFILAAYFCQDYDASTAETAYGVPLVTVYQPSSDYSSYPGRSSLAQTFELINADLDSAEKYITTAPEKAARYFTSDAVKAFRARVALYMDDYPTAIQYAEPLVTGGMYPFVADAKAYANLWLNDSGDECIMQVYADINELASSSSYGYLSFDPTKEIYSPMYIPTADMISLYASDDIRLTQGFLNVSVDFSGVTGQVYLCNKYPGNPSFYVGNNSNYVNSPKPFRIAEQYLILAEAYANTGNDPKASELINALKSNRIPSYVETSYAGSQLISEIRNERVRELYGEGFRFLDLRRYNEGFTRGVPQNSDVVYNIATELTVSASDTRWLWPIPTAEITSNPQIENQQNPGYSAQ